MENQRSNPLAGYFRQPAIYIKLPSGGKWWNENALDLPQSGEIPVFSMTTKDEVILRTPDALMNGQGIVEVIQSCCPNIKDAWNMPGVDVDAVLIAVRIATYGNEMAFDSKCPHCEEENEHEIDLAVQLGSIKSPDYKKIVEYKDLKIKLKPQHYFGVNRANMVGFEEQKITSILNMSELEPEQKSAELAKSMQRLVALGIDAVVDSTEYIETSEGDRILDKQFLTEFYNNAESNVIRLMQDRMEQLTVETRLPALNLSCHGCSKEYKIDLTFDYANFFGKGF